jgi:hypothetical protein
MKTVITFEIDTQSLDSFTDEHVAALWHIAQANPAAHGDKDAGHLAAAIGFEIIKRWLKAAPASLYHHQLHDHYWSILKDHGKWVEPDYSTWVPNAVLEGRAA